MRLCVSVCVCAEAALVTLVLCVFFLRFLNVKIQEGDAHNIFCPAYECYQLVPVHVIESVVSREMDQRYLQFDIKVETQLARKIIVCTSSSRPGLCSSFSRFSDSLLPFTLYSLTSFLTFLLAGICGEQSIHPLVSCSSL